jgi:hypothetical protein
MILEKGGEEKQGDEQILSSKKANSNYYQIKMEGILVKKSRIFTRVTFLKWRPGADSNISDMDNQLGAVTNNIESMM